MTAKSGTGVGPGLASQNPPGMIILLHPLRRLPTKRRNDGASAGSGAYTEHGCSSCLLPPLRRIFLGGEIPGHCIFVRCQQDSLPCRQRSSPYIYGNDIIEHHTISNVTEARTWTLLPPRLLKAYGPCAGSIAFQADGILLTTCSLIHVWYSFGPLFCPSADLSTYQENQALSQSSPSVRRISTRGFMVYYPEIINR